VSRHPSPLALRDAPSLPEAERTELLRHVRDCAPCRAALAADDPTRLFALLASEPVPLEHLERLSARLEAAVGDAPGRRRQRFGPWVAGAMAASVLLAAVLGSLFWPPGEAPGPLPPLAAPAQVAGEARAGEVELYLPPEAEVVNFSIGETQVVMIFNEELEL
jgi:hypothetical protein